MSTHAQVKDALLAAHKFVARLGAAVLEVRAKDTNGSWYIEAEIVNPLPANLGNEFEVDGVRISVIDLGVPAPRVSRPQRQAPRLAR